MIPALLGFSFGEADTVVTFVSSMAIILGAVFVVVELNDNKKLVAAANEQARAATIQAQASTEQMKLTNEIADMDMIMRLYEFANTKEFQTSWLTVLDAHLGSFEEFERMPRDEQVAFHQVASLFESLGVLADRGIVTLATVEDMFLAGTAWEAMKPFLEGVPTKYGGEGYYYFRKLKEELEKVHRQSQGEAGESGSGLQPVPSRGAMPKVY
jgi:hypothetical protein